MTDLLSCHENIFEEDGITKTSFRIQELMGGIIIEKKIGLAYRDLVGCHVIASESSSVARLKIIGYPILLSANCLNSGIKRHRVEFEFVISGNVGNLNCVEYANKLQLLITRLILGENVTKETIDLKPIIPKRKLLVLINPKSGSGNALKLWNKYGLPMFKDANIEYTEIQTQRQYHALEYVRDASDLVDQYQGIVICSGDGLIHEVLQGIMARKDWGKVISRLPIGVLPGGSGNGLAHTVADAAGEAHLPLHNAFIIAKGKTCPLDISRVETKSGKSFYSFLSVEFGFIADMDLESDVIRWMGEARFTVYAIKRLLALRKSTARLSFLPLTQQVESRSNNENVTISKKSKESTNADGTPRTAKSPSLVLPPSYWSLHPLVDDAPSESTSSDVENGIIIHGPESNRTLVAPISEPVPNNWTVIEDEFWFMWNANCQWMSSEGNIAPHSKLDDGLLQLSYLRKNGPNGGASRNVMLQYLLGLAEGAHLTNHAIEMRPTVAYRVEPLNMHPDSKIAVDGESIQVEAFQVEMFRGLGLCFSAPSSLNIASNNNNENQLAV